MGNKIKLNSESRLINIDFINKVEALENAMLAMDNPSIAKGNSDMFPLKHSFSEGVYIREMFMAKGSLVIGKLYKISHTWFLLQGEITVATDEGVNHYIAPCYVHAPEGTKRVIQALEDSVFVNVYPNPDNITDINTLEDMLTCTSYNKYKEYKLLNE
jgi:quercetin dioxygenase-like cupin family protein